MRAPKFRPLPLVLVLVGSVKVNSYRYRADKSTIFGMRGLWGLTIKNRVLYSICQPSWILEPESPIFDPNHAFLSSIEAEIITFLPKKAAI